MASASAIRSPCPLPPPSPAGIPDQSEPCPFRRSRSKVFYESEITSGTSWEFRGIQTDSPVLIPVHKMQLSLLRSPIVNGRTESPIPMSPDSSAALHRSISSPTKDDLGGNGSDGSRNSTGSSTGSHRSQDSGFSDSGESKPSRRSGSGSIIVPPNGTTMLGHSSPHHPNNSLLSTDRSNQYNENCSQIEQHDGNKNYLQAIVHNNNNSIQHQTHSRSSPLALPPLLPPPQDCHYAHEEQGLLHPGKHPLHHQSQSPSIYSQPHHHYVHERCCSTPLPSPIPHSGSGCGKLILKNTSYQQIQSMKSPYPHHLQSEQQRLGALHHYHGTQQQNQCSNHGDYVETNGNSSGECSNCIYQEIVLSQSPPPNCNSSHQHQPHPHNHYHSQNRSTGNYALYSTISTSDQNGHLGAPISSSTPKRSNISSSSTSRLTIMQKIDNFESLNKNKKSLDSNNNSNNMPSTSTANTSNSSSSGGKTFYQTSANSSKGSLVLCSGQQNKHTVKTLTNGSPLSHLGHGVSQTTPTAASVYETSGKKSFLSKSKKPSKLSNSSLSTSSISNPHQNSSSTSTSASTFSVMTDFSNNENKTVIQRVPELLQVPPPVPQSSSSSSSRLQAPPPPLSTMSISSLKNDDEGVGEDAENNNNFTLNEFSTYASQTKLKSCIKASPKWESLPRGYKRVPVKGFNSSFISEPATAAEVSSEVSVSNDSSEKVIIVKSHFDNDAMRLWLHELRSQTEPECLHMLQTKSILSESTDLDSLRSASPRISSDTHGSQGASSITTGDTACSVSETDSVGQGSLSTKGGANGNNKTGSVIAAIHGISSPLMSIRNVERMANVVSGEFAKICKNIEFGFLSQVPNLVLSLVRHVEEFLRAFQGSSGFGNLQKLENKLSRSCRRLHRSAQVMIDVTSPNTSGTSNTDTNNIYSIIEPETGGTEGYHVAVTEVVDGIVTVGNLFSQVVDLRLTRDLSCILDTIEGGGIPSKVALKSFATVLIDGGNHLCRLASEIRTVRGLLGVILDGRDNYDKILSLRCLATILCVGEAVKDFDRAGGFEIVADFMYESIVPMDIKIEAVSVLTQATDPWIDLETSLSSLGIHLEKIVIALTNLIHESKLTEESFLLVVAAISNLTFLEVSSIGILRRCNTVSLIIDMIDKAKTDFSVFVLDHVATILANMAGVESCRADIVKSGGVHALLNFLQRRPSPSKESASEIMACERVQQKSTIAISRLCTEEGVAKFILERGGFHRLVALSRDEKERNYSDGVLIAALATLRKLVTVCGEDVIRGLQAEDLIQPRLLDSFLLYSSRQESYV